MNTTRTAWKKRDENDLKLIQKRIPLTIIRRVMTGFIWYCINFTRNNNFTNHDMSLLLWNNPPLSWMIMMITMICSFSFVSNLLQTTLYKTHLLFKLHILPTFWTYKIKYCEVHKKMMWLSHHLFETSFVKQVYYIMMNGNEMIFNESEK